MGLLDSSQPITIAIVGVMMAIRWLEAHVKENNQQETPTKEQMQELNVLKVLDLFETTCKILNIPMEVKKIWARRRLMPCFRANVTASLYEYAKKHMSKHRRVYSAYQLDIGAGAFKRAFVTHQNAVTTAVKRTSRISEYDGREREEMLKEDLERNVTFCLQLGSAGISLGGKNDCTFSAKIGQPGRIWIGILRRTAKNESNGGVGIDETSLVSES